MKQQLLNYHKSIHSNSIIPYYKKSPFLKMIIYVLKLPVTQRLCTMPFLHIIHNFIHLYHTLTLLCVCFLSFFLSFSSLLLLSFCKQNTVATCNFSSRNTFYLLSQSFTYNPAMLLKLNVFG